MDNPSDNHTKKTLLFEPGEIVATPTALDTLAHVARLLERRPEQVAATLIERHLLGDWGDLDPDDKALNDDAVKHGDRILSAYEVGDSQTPVKLWLITEADRSRTTLLLPEDY